MEHKREFRGKSLSRYFVYNFLFMLLVFALPINILIAGQFVYQNRAFQDQMRMESKGELGRIRTKLDSMLLSVQKSNIALSADAHVQRFAAIEQYRFDYDMKSRLAVLQRLFLEAETSWPLLDAVVVHFLIPNVYVTSTSAKAFFTGDTLTYDKRFAYDLVKRYETQGLLQSIETDSRFLYFYTNIVSNGKLRGGIASRCMLSALVNEIASSSSALGNRVIILSGDDRVTVDSVGDAAGKNLPSVLGGRFDGSLSGLDGQTVEINGERYLVSTAQSDFMDWRYLLLWNGRQTADAIVNNYRIMAAVLAVSTASMMYAAYWLTTRFNRPLNVVLQILTNPGQTMSGQYEMLIRRVDELGVINQMIEKSRLRDLLHQHKLNEQREQLTLIEMQALRSQINPHFIYNTLESINWKIMAKLGLENEASDMVIALSRLLRLTFRGNEKTVSLREEQEHAKIYISLQMARFKDRFSMEWNTDPAVDELRVPPLMLQPVFENAVIHGGSGNSAEPVAIRYEARIDEGSLVISICDSGCGMEADKLEDLRAQLRTNTALTVEGHIGLLNTHRRIALTYGEAYGLSIDSAPGAGTCVKITLPLVR